MILNKTSNIKEVEDEPVLSNINIVQHINKLELHLNRHDNQYRLLLRDNQYHMAISTATKNKKEMNQLVDELILTLEQYKQEINKD